MLVSLLFQLIFSAYLLGGTFVWVTLLALVTPAIILIFLENRPFNMQMKASIISFEVGIVVSLVLLYLRYGANMIESLMLHLPGVVHEMPLEQLSSLIENVSAALGRNIVQDDFYNLFEKAVEMLIPVYQANFPGMLFGGGLVSAVLCVGLSGRMLKKQGRGGKGAYCPLRRWALPASTTGGLLLMICAGYIIYLSDMPQGMALLYAVYDIAIVAFCIQAFSSIARRMYASPLKRGVQIFILIAFLLLSMSGASLYLGIYGCASAIFGRYGAVRQKLEQMNSKEH